VPRTPQTPLAVVMTSFDAGGTERQMIELIRRLDRSRWDVRVACFHARGPWHAQVAEVAPVTSFPIRGFGRPDTCRHAFAFARWCARHRIEVVHATDLYTNVFALPAAAIARVPVRIGSRRGHNTDRSPAHLAMQRTAYRCAHVVVANSRAAADYLQRENVRANKVVIVPNGVDTAAFTPAKATERRRQVVTVANFRPEKGYDILVDAAALVLQRYPDARFQCVGIGAELPAIQTRLAERGIAPAFALLGARHDVAALLAAADIFVLPSRSESMPNSILEAMAANLPVVATAVGGIPELIDDGRTGFVVASENPAALAERLCELMQSPVLGTSLGDRARHAAQSLYSFDRMVQAFDSLYARELETRGRARAEMAA
jgi:glycosyltransferase involved in cell wall biosynthesis